MGSLEPVESLAVSMFSYGGTLSTWICSLQWTLVTGVELGACKCIAGETSYKWVWWYWPVTESRAWSSQQEAKGALTVQFVVQWVSHVWLFVTSWTAAQQASLSSNLSQSFLKCMFIELVMPSNHLIHCHPLLPLPSIFPSIRVFSNESALCIRWPKYWRFSFNISPHQKISGLIFRISWFGLPAAQGTLNCLL